MPKDRDMVVGNNRKRPIVVTIFAILTLLSVPADIVTFARLHKDTYQEYIKNDESLIRDGELNYHGKTIQWERQSDFQKKIITKRLNRYKKIASAFSLFRFFKGLFIVLPMVLFYGLWKLRKWVCMPLIIYMVFGILFNAIFPFFTFGQTIFAIALDVVFLMLGVKFFRKYFI